MPYHRVLKKQWGVVCTVYTVDSGMAIGFVLPLLVLHLDGVLVRLSLSLGLGCCLVGSTISRLLLESCKNLANLEDFGVCVAGSLPLKNV